MAKAWTQGASEEVTGISEHLEIERALRSPARPVTSVCWGHTEVEEASGFLV